jgi:predicted deacylase
LAYGILSGVLVVVQQLHRRLIFVLLVVALLIVVPALHASAAPHRQAGDELTIGFSGQGTPITAIRIGGGPRKLVLVGNTHGGPEANTHQLMLQLIDYYRQRPELVPPEVRLYLIPTLNPDGLALGSRFNANGVDLNRNMDTGLDSCPENDWSTTVQGAYGLIADTGGPYAESEVESRLIRDFLLDASGAVFFHSNAGLVFPALCEHAPSIAMAEIFATAAGYTYSRYWPLYQITGGMHDWAASLGIAAITPELITGDQPEFEQNVAGVQAVLDNAAALLPLPAERVEGGVAVPALIWRFWYAHGGNARFGPPLLPAEAQGDVVRQRFARAVIEWRPGAADTPEVLQLAPLGREALGGRSFPPTQPDGVRRYVVETEQLVGEPLLGYWERAGGAALLGYPLSPELVELGGDGQPRVVQYFERARLDLGDGVQLAPLGWQSLHRSVRDPRAAQQPR